MRNKRNIFIYILAAVLFIPNMVYAENTRETTYGYDYWGRVIEATPFFDFYDVIDADNLEGVNLSSMDDVTVSGDRIYIVDSIESRLNVLDKDTNFITSIKVIRTSDGKIAINPETNEQIVLNAPEGVFVHEPENEIYIADTGNNRIIVLNEEDFTLKKIINEPEGMIGETTFKPSKVVVDRINRIYVIVQSGFEGIIELNQEGDFVRYFGVNSPQVNLLDYFWRSQASDEQQDRMQKILAPSFNNIEVDEEGFIYAVTFDSSAQDKVFRFNPNGENILREEGFWPIIGDLNMAQGSTELVMSKFVDIALTNYGAYALLDQEYGRIFLYNFDGELMNIFGGEGFMKGELIQPTAIDWVGDNLIVTDKQMATAYIYKPTEIGELALEAAEEYYHGNWDASTELLLEAVALDGNYEIAYSAIGKSYLMQEDYETAMYYFKLGDNRSYYSEAFDGYRGIWIENNFPWIFGLLLVGVAWILYSEYAYFKKKG